jgi:hypothetical protein
VVASVATAADAVDVAVAVVVSAVTEDEAVAVDVVLPEGEPKLLPGIWARLTSSQWRKDRWHRRVPRSQGHL